MVAKDRETLVLVSLLRRQKVQLLPSLRISSGNVSRTRSCYVNTVTSTTPALNGSGDGLPERVWTLSIDLRLHSVRSCLVSESRSVYLSGPAE